MKGLIDPLSFNENEAKGNNLHRRSQTETYRSSSLNTSENKYGRQNVLLEKINFLNNLESIPEAETNTGNKSNQQKQKTIPKSRSYKFNNTTIRKFHLDHIRIGCDHICRNKLSMDLMTQKNIVSLSASLGGLLPTSKKSQKPNIMKKEIKKAKTYEDSVEGNLDKFILDSSQLRGKIKLMTVPNYLDKRDDKKQRFQRIKMSSSFVNTPNLVPKQKNQVKTRISGRLYQLEKDQAKGIKSNQEDRRNNLIELGTWKKELEIISDCLHQLIQYGTLERKLNKWIQTYFQNKKKGYLELFMKRIQKKKSLANQIYYEAYKSSEKLLGNIVKKLQFLSDKQIYFLGLEITQYRSFLEEKIANKHSLELAQISERMKKNICSYEMKEFAKDLVAKNNPNTEILTFYTDLDNIESNYGKLNLLSIKNRKRFKYINDSQNSIKDFLS